MRLLPKRPPVKGHPYRKWVIAGLVFLLVASRDARHIAGVFIGAAAFIVAVVVARRWARAQRCEPRDPRDGDLT